MASQKFLRFNIFNVDRINRVAGRKGLTLCGFYFLLFNLSVEKTANIPLKAAK